MVSSPRSPSTSIKDNSNNKVTLATSTKEKRGRRTDKVCSRFKVTKKISDNMLLEFRGSYYGYTHIWVLY